MKRGEGGPLVTLERIANTANVIDVLDRVLDKGIVVDAWMRISLAGSLFGLWMVLSGAAAQDARQNEPVSEVHGCDRPRPVGGASRVRKCNGAPAVGRRIVLPFHFPLSSPAPHSFLHFRCLRIGG